VALLAVRGHETALAFRRGQWVVARRGKEVRQVRPHSVEEIQCHGAVDVTPSARAAVLARGVPLVFLTLDGRYRGRLDGPRSPTAALQLAQVRWLEDEGRARTLASGLVAGKLAACRALLLAVQRRRRSPAVASAACVLRATGRKTADASSLDVLRGLEGHGTATYFSVFGDLLRNDAFRWTTRTRRPPRDPLNACLSFGYTLLAVRVESAVRAVGLLPGLGALHVPESGRTALVFDLVEEFRAPFVDRMVLRLVNRRQLAPEDFEDPAWRDPVFVAPGAPDKEGEPGVRPSGAVYLGPAARRLFLQEFAAGLRRDVTDADDGSRVRAGWLLERQARRLARVFQGREPAYGPARVV